MMTFRAAISLALLAAAALVATATATPSQAEIDAFLAWFADIGGKAPKASLATFPGMATGVLATQDLKPNDVVFEVPMKYVICRRTLEATQDGDIYAEIRNDEDLVAAFLAFHRFLGESSKWAPYIKALPTYVPLPARFTKKELKLLEQPALATRAKETFNRYESRYKHVVQGALKKLFKAIGASAEDIAQHATLDAYMWGVSLVGSRALSIQGKKYLVPFADMFNYEPHTEKRDANSGANFLKYHKVNTHTFEVLTDRITRAGDQIFEDYGDNPNAIYFEHHGFVHGANPFDCAEVAMPKFNTRTPRGRARTMLLQKLGIDMRQINSCLTPTDVQSRIAPFLHAYLVVYTLSSKQLKQCEAHASAGLNRRRLATACFGEHVAAGELYKDEATQATLTKLIANELKRYSTSIEADEALLAAGDLTENAALAISYRLSRKRLLQAITDKLSSLEAPEVQEEEMEAVAVDAATASAVSVDAAAADGAATPAADSSSAPAADSKDWDADTDVAHYEKLAAEFNSWFRAADPPVMLLEAFAAGKGMRLGTSAVRDIAAEEIYLSVPQQLIMDQQSARASPFLSELFAELDERFHGGDMFHEIVFHLMYERFVLGDDSYWAPYLNYLPTREEMLFPSFYSAEEDKELAGSDILPQIRSYRKEVARKFAAVNRVVLEPYSRYLPPAAFTRENYEWAHAIMDSRSIWWGGTRHLVPMLDLINCAEGPDPTRVHSTVLDSTGKNAITRAPWAFEKGSQVFENYGQPNYVYFQYHGFSLTSNTHDCVSVPVWVPEDDPDFETKKKNLQDMAGLKSTSTRLCISPHSITREVRAWFRATSDKPLEAALKELAQQRLHGYPTSAEQDLEILSTPLSERVYNAVAFRLSEKRLLREFAGLPPLEPTPARTVLDAA